MKRFTSRLLAGGFLIGVVALALAAPALAVNNAYVAPQGTVIQRLYGETDLGGASASVAADATFTGSLINSLGATAFAVQATGSASGSLELIGYADVAGNFPIWTQSTTYGAGSGSYVAVNSPAGKPFAAVQAEIISTAAGTQSATFSAGIGQ